MNSKINKNKTQELWDIYLSIEEDLIGTIRYINPDLSNKNIHSIEFGKIIMISCASIEHILKIMATKLKHPSKNIHDYNEMLLKYYMGIKTIEVYIPRLGTSVIPFKNLRKTNQNRKSNFSWWNSNNAIKHHMINGFKKATFNNAVYSLSALYVLILYHSRITGDYYEDYQSKFLKSDYSSCALICPPNKDLPDSNKFGKRINRKSDTFYPNNTISCGNKIPRNNTGKNGDMFFLTKDADNMTTNPNHRIRKH